MLTTQLLINGIQWFDGLMESQTPTATLSLLPTKKYNNRPNTGTKIVQKFSKINRHHQQIISVVEFSEYPVRLIK